MAINKITVEMISIRRWIAFQIKWRQMYILNFIFH